MSDHPTPNSEAGETADPGPALPARGRTPTPAVSGGSAVVRREPEPGNSRAERRAERTVSGLFILSTIATIGFLADYFGGDPHKQYYTPVLGATLGLALLGIGSGLVVWANQLMVDEEVYEERHPLKSSEQDRREFSDDVRAGLEDTGALQRPILRRTLLGAVGVLSVAPLGLLYSLGPNPRGARELKHTRWTKGARLVDQFNSPVNIDQLQIGGFITVFPENHTDIDSAADSTALLIRLRAGEDHPVAGREDWSVQGFVCYSKICTHAGCPVGLYEQQTHKLLCPCHQSQFLVTEHCKPVFGPASRSLPQLAIELDQEGHFFSKYGDFAEPIGAGFWERA